MVVDCGPYSFGSPNALVAAPIAFPPVEMTSFIGAVIARIFSNRCLFDECCRSAGKSAWFRLRFNALAAVLFISCFSCWSRMSYVFALFAESCWMFIALCALSMASFLVLCSCSAMRSLCFASVILVLMFIAEFASALRVF